MGQLKWLVPMVEQQPYNNLSDAKSHSFEMIVNRIRALFTRAQRVGLHLARAYNCATTFALGIAIMAEGLGCTLLAIAEVVMGVAGVCGRASEERIEGDVEAGDRASVEADGQTDGIVARWTRNQELAANVGRCARWIREY